MSTNTGKTQRSKEPIIQNEWDVAPPKNELDQYDEPKARQLKLVEAFVKSVPTKSLKKKLFYTISCNVLCPDLSTKDKTLPNDERDHYLPLEISIIKWSLGVAIDLNDHRELETKHWMIYPGKPTLNSVCDAKDHKEKHKIRFAGEDVEGNPYITRDLNEIVKGINSFIGPDKTVFSLDIFRLRQDLGCLKWLNKQTGYKMKPITVYSLRDLYVAIMRRFYPENESVGIGIATFRLRDCKSAHDTEIQCKYHQVLANEDNNECCQYCTLSLVRNHTNQLLDDYVVMGMPEPEPEPESEAQPEAKPEAKPEANGK